MASKLIAYQNKPNNVKENSCASIKHMRLVTALIIGCILLAYSFLFFDNNVDSDTSTFTKIAAIIYFIAIMSIGMSINAFSVKSLGLLLSACIYMCVNYSRFGMGIKNDIITVCVIALFLIVRRISIPRKQVFPILLAIIIPFILIVLVSRTNSDSYIVSSFFNNMSINPNTMSQITFVGIFAIILLIGTKRFQPLHLLVYILGFILEYYYASRTAMICLAFMMIGNILVYSKITSKFFLNGFILVLLSSFAVIVIYTYWLPTVISPDFVIFGKKLFTGRQWIYSEILGYIMTSPTTFLFGYGHTSFESLSGILLNAHNYWLQLWLQYGLVLMLPMLIVFVKAVKHVVKHYDKYTAKLFVTYCICLALFLMLEAPITGRTMSIIFLMPLFLIRNFVRQKKIRTVKIQQAETQKYFTGKTVERI